MSKIYIDNDTWTFMFTALRGINTEISFYCAAEQIEKGFLVSTPFIPKQFVSGAETTVTVEGQQEAMKWFSSKEKVIRCLVHSHVNMDVFQSGGDKQTTNDIMQSLREGGSINPESFFLTIVTNKRGDFYTILLLPFWNLQIKLDTEVLEDNTDELQKAIDGILETQILKEKKREIQYPTRKDYDDATEWWKELNGRGGRNTTSYTQWINGVECIWSHDLGKWVPINKKTPVGGSL